MKPIYFIYSNIWRFYHWSLTSIFRFAKIRKNRIYISSFDGKYCDSPKQIALKLAQSHSHLEIIYHVNENERLPYGIISCKNGTIKDMYYRATAALIIDNNYGGNAVWLKESTACAKKKFKREVLKKKKKDQYIISTWHGTPLKKMGVDSNGSKIVAFDCPNTIMVLGNKYTAEIMRRLTFNKVRIEVTGTPRNDVLFNYDRDEQIKIKRKLGISDETRLFLYAPTFRESDGEGTIADYDNSGINQIKNIDFIKLCRCLKDKFGGEWIIGLRFHHYVAEKMNWESLKNQFGEKVINANALEDMSDCLRITDFLLTDASSSFFDFSLTNKPCMLFFPDVELYKKKRGLYLDFSEMPFLLTRSFDELIDGIIGFDIEKYNNERLLFLKRIGNADDGKSTDRIVRLIEKDFLSKI